MTTTDRSLSPQEAGQVFVTPAAYADEAWFHDACTVLRREDPIHLVENADFAPFWALTKHADVLDVELHPNEFRNAPRPVLQNHEADARQAEQGELLRTLIHMDAPDHRVIRGITADWFLPKSMARLDARLQELAVQSVTAMQEHGGTAYDPPVVLGVLRCLREHRERLGKRRRHRHIWRMQALADVRNGRKRKSGYAGFGAPPSS